MSEAQHSVDILRALVNTQKNSMSLTKLLKEYRELEGKTLPFKNYGYKSAEQYLKSSGEFLIINDRGEVHVSARPNKDSAHITSMVARQRKDNRKSRRSSGYSNNRMPVKNDQSWNKSSYSSNVYRNLPKANSISNNDIRSKQHSLKQRLGDSNNNTSSINNRNITNPKVDASRDTKNNMNGYSKTQPQSHLITMQTSNNNTSKIDLSSRLSVPRHQIDQEQQKVQQQPTQNKILPENNSNNKNNKNESQSKYVNQNSSQINNDGQQKQNQKQNVASSKSTGTLSLLESRLESNRNFKNLNLNKSDNGKLRKPNFQMNTNIQLQLPTTLPVNRVGTSIQDRLNVHKIKTNSDIISANKNTSNQNLLGSLQNFEKKKNLEKSSVINKETNKTKKILLPTQKYDFNPTLSSITSLVNYCEARGYSAPEYNLLQPKFANRKHVCSVKINEEKYTTYPKYFDDPELAKAACAAIAIEEIKLAESKIVAYPVCMDSDLDLIMKIYQELKINHTNGIFIKMFPKVFESKFQQTLPDHWFSLVAKSKFFILETTVHNQNTIILANFNVPETDEPQTDLDEIIIDPLILPWDSKYWNLYITHCASTIEIWARIVDKEYSQQLDSLLNDIDLAMLTEKTRPGSLKTGQMYLVCVSECWHRVRLERMDKAIGKCLCFFIDFGDGDWLPMDQLFACDKKFLNLPPQAVPFSLFGLEDFAENPIANQHLNEMLMGKTLIAQIFTKKETYEGKNSTTSSSSYSGSSESLNEIVKIQAVLYDTSSNIDVVLNPLLINKICDDTPAPELKQNGPTNVNITHITDNGDVYLQILDCGLYYVQKLISQLVESKFQRDQYKINSDDVKSSHLYLIYDKDDNNWYRGCLADNNVESQKFNEFQMFYVDYGFTKLVSLSNIFSLESLSAALSRYPRQGLKAKMHNLPPLNEFVLNRLKDLLPSDSVAIVKLAFNKLDTSRNVVPQIIVFIRIERNQSLCNVNDAIRMEYELVSNDFPVETYKITQKSETNSSSRSSPTSPQPKSITDFSPGFRSLSARSPISVPSTSVKGSLPKLNMNMSLPKKGDLFNVLVTIASNPFNFFVRPYDDFLQFQDMMTELQNYCQNNDEFIPDDMIETGEAYAVLLSDGFYYRCIIEITLPNQMCVVYFCDCGDRNVVDVNTLRTLPVKCRELPAQAIQAKLHGVKPIKGEWTLEDSIRFSQLTVGQKFATVVKNISIDDFNPNKKSKVVEVILIDVLTSKDIYIHEILIEENRAILS